MPTQLVHDPNDPNYKYKPADVPAEPKQDDVLVKNPDEQSAYQIIPGSMLPPGSTPASGQQQATTPVVAGQGVQAPATQTAGQENVQTGTPGTDGAINPDSYTFTKEQLEAMGMSPEDGALQTAGQAQQAGATQVVGQDGTTQTDGQAGATQADGQGEDGTTQTTGQEQQVTTPSTHLYDYANRSLSDIFQNEGKDKSYPDILNDYYAWARENGKTVNILDVMEAIKGKDLSKSPAQNADDEKKRLRRERWDKLGNFLLHLGNVVGNVAGGGMGAVKLEDPVKWTERQRMLKEKAEQQRDRYNESILAQMAKQDAAQRKAELDKRREERDQTKLDLEERKIGVAEAESKRKAYKDDFAIKMAQNKFDYQKEKDELDRKLKERQISVTEHRLAIEGMRAATSDYIARNPIQSTTEVRREGSKKITERKSRRGGGTPSQQGNSGKKSAFGKR